MIKTGDFRKELKKRMPGYKWTVHKPTIYGLDLTAIPKHLTATGIQSSGLQRISTLQVIVKQTVDGLEYISKSSGFGKNAPWLEECTEPTLARSLRGLQDAYVWKGNNYLNHAGALRDGRNK